MIRAAIFAAAAVALAASPPALAQSGPAVGVDAFYSSDAEDTEVFRGGLNLDWRHRGPDDYQGIRVERARIKPLGLEARSFDRVYVRLADTAGGWKWAATIGTDGHSLLGSATLHDEAKFRKEVFIEREMVETPLGVKRGIYYTFAGAAIDLPADERNNFSVFAGVQDFTGDNVRLHLRGNYVHVVKPDLGLSAQLRGRFFHSSAPREFDYYSPRWFAQLLPVLQMRRFVGGWQLLGAAGYGAQRDSDQRWQRARYLNARVTSPRIHRDWAVNANALYSNNPVGTGFTYSYVQFNIGLTRAF